MPVSKEKKQETIQELKDILTRSTVVVIGEYRGLTAAQLSLLRNRLRPFNSRFLVTKNTLVLKSLEEMGGVHAEEILQGPSALGVTFGDTAQPVRTILDFARENDALKIRGGWMGDRLLSKSDVQMLPTLPATEVLRAQTLGSVVSPVSGFVGVLDGALRGLVYVLQARADQLGEATA